MSSLTEIFHITVLLVLLIIGTIGNGFLVIVNVRKLIQNKRLISIKLLLTCLGMSRLGLQFLLTFQGFLSVFFVQVYVNIYGSVFLFIWMFLNSSSLWFATCLGMFYCLKISGFTHPYFLWLKFRISKLISWMLLSSLLVSGITALLCSFVMDDSARSPTYRTNISSLDSHNSERTTVNEVLLINLILLFPLGLFIMCTVTLFASLYSHSQRMQARSSALGNPSAEAHFSALRTVITFFCLFISYFSALMVNLTFTVPFRSFWFFFLKDVMAAYPSGHSIIIILGNSQYQQPFRKILGLAKKP